MWIAFGIVVFSWPGPSPDTLTELIAALALAHGAISGAEAVAVPLNRGGRAWLVVDAAAAIVVGLVVLVWPGISATAVLGAWAVVLGALQLIGARVLPLSGERATALAWSGLVPVAFGVVMLVRSGGGALASATLIAAFAIVTGVLQAASALDLRAVLRRARS